MGGKQKSKATPRKPDRQEKEEQRRLKTPKVDKDTKKTEKKPQTPREIEIIKPKVQQNERKYEQDFMIAFLAVFVLNMRNAIFPVDVYEIYQGKQFPKYFGYYILFLRCLATRVGSKDTGRTLIRNLIFNVIRQIAPSYWASVILLGRSMNHAVIMEEVKWCLLSTTVLHFIPYGFFKSIRYLWIWLLMEYVLCVPFFFVTWMNIMHFESGMYAGDLVMVLVTCWLCCHNATGWNILEDMVFGDMGLVQNFASITFPMFYAQWVICIPGIYLLQYYLLKNTDLSVSYFQNFNDLIAYNVPQVNNYIQLSYYNVNHKLVYSIMNLFFAPSHFYMCFMALGGMRVHDSQETKKANGKKGSSNKKVKNE